MDASNNYTDSQKQEKKRKRTKITSGYIGYTLAPRINAAGRIRTATLAVELLLSENAENAANIADELCRANKERQAEENKIMEAAYQKIDELDIDNNPVIVLDADDWHHGVIGIVSSRITEKYSRPSILVSFEGGDGDATEDVGKGSGRSIKGMNLVDALCYCSDHLVKFGGHELAAGLSVKRSELNNFRTKINEYAKLNLKAEDMIPTLDADAEIDFADISLALAGQIQVLEPYGVGNPIPTFVMRNVRVNEIAAISNGKHTRFTFSDNDFNGSLCGMYFSNSPSSLDIYVGDSVDVLFNIDINEWLGRKSVQIVVKDIKLSAVQTGNMEVEYKRFEEIWNGASFTSDENVFPTREDFAAFYRFIVNSVRSGNDVFLHRELIIKLSAVAKYNTYGYIKLKIIIKVLKELNLLGIEEIEHEVYKFSVHYSTSKTDLEKSNLLRRLRSQLNR